MPALAGQVVHCCCPIAPNFACKINTAHCKQQWNPRNFPCREQCRDLRSGGPRGAIAMRCRRGERAPTTRAFTPVFDGLWGAPTKAGGHFKQKPGTVPRPGTLREFQFHQYTDLRYRVQSYFRFAGESFCAASGLEGRVNLPHFSLQLSLHAEANLKSP